MRKLILLAAGLMVAVLIVAEAAMQPSPQDRLLLSSTFGASFGVTLVAGWTLLRLTRRLRSLRTAVLMIPLVAVGVAALTIAAAALTMFLSVHDLRLALVALGLGVGLGAALAVTVSRPLADDLARLAVAARRVGSGDLSARSGVERPDEVGEAARAVDRMIEELAALEQQRGRNEQSRRRFLAAIGHDLRTPLTSLQAAVEALQDGMAPDPERYLRSMARDVEHLRSLVDDLFMLTRIEAGDLDLRPVPIDAVELVEETLEAMTPLAERRGVRLLLTTHAPVPLRADPRAVARVVRNLVDNAVRHTAPDTEVTVSVSALQRDVEIRVRDQGPGFPPELRDTAWRDAVRADSARGRDGARAGLGLTIARGLVEAHRGEIWIEDAEGGQVALRLPADGSGDRTGPSPDDGDPGGAV